MNDKRKELMEIYEGMTTENKNMLLSYAVVMQRTERAMKQQYGLDAEPPKPAA
ncbi:MAG: hypothetical protein LBE74_00710 [Treponema sp.]|jgi:hypothetical protein|nr:hypothetical protein [Treponema sp.]